MRLKMNRIMYLALMIGAFSVLVNAQSVSSVTTSGNTVQCILSNGSAVYFSPATDNMVRVEYRQGNANSSVSDIMDANYSSTATFTNVSSAGDPIVLTGPNYSVTIAKATFGIVFKNSAGTTLFSSTAVAQYSLSATILGGNYYGIVNQTYWGGGYNNPSSNLVSGTGDVVMYVEDAKQNPTTMEGGAASPFSWTPQGFGILIDMDQGDFNFSNATTLKITRTVGCINTNCLFWLMAGTPLQIISSYYKATGSYPVPPKWTCGFMNSQWGLSQAELETIIQTYRGAKNIPLDAFIFDYDWFDYNNRNNVADGDFQWDLVNFPAASSNFNTTTGGDLKRFADSNGVKMVGIRKPHGLWAGDGTLGDCGDFTNATIRKTFWEKFVNPSWDSYARGIIGFWNDEADACDNVLSPFEALDMEKSMYMGVRYDSTAGLATGYHNNRVWSLNRSYFGGAQRYAWGHWSGDIVSTNQALQDGRAYMLTSINLGSAWWGQDIGGFQSVPTPADYQHWMQLGAFTPIFRVHGNNGTKRYPWAYTNGYNFGGTVIASDGGVAERVATEYIRLRYSLIPYIYSAYWKLHRDGIPLVRPLVMDYPADNNVAQIVESWMFGDNILVSPVVTNYGATTKSVYLPQGTWVNYWTDAVYTGGAAVSIPTNADTMPILVKQGAIIPTQKVVSYINNYPITQNTKNAVVPVTIHVYGGANSSYEYVDDDGVTYNYEKGQYRDVIYTHTSTSTSEQVAIGAPTGSFTQTDSNGVFVFHGISWTPVSVAVQSGDISANQVAATALSAAAAPAWAYDQGKKQVLVKVASPFATGTIGISSTTGVIRGLQAVSLRSTRIMLLQGRLIIPITYLGNGPLTVRLISASGAVAREYRFSSLRQGDQSLSLSTGNLAQGVCFVLLSSGDNTVMKKVMVVR
jgi:alpha-glucosidase